MSSFETASVKPKTFPMENWGDSEIITGIIRSSSRKRSFDSMTKTAVRNDAADIILLHESVHANALLQEVENRSSGRMTALENEPTAFINAPECKTNQSKQHDWPNDFVCSSITQLHVDVRLAIYSFAYESMDEYILDHDVRSNRTNDPLRQWYVALKLGDLEAMQVLKTHFDTNHSLSFLWGLDFETIYGSMSTCVKLASDGHLRALQWAIKQGFPWNKAYEDPCECCTAAARSGHLSVLQWLRTHGCPWDEETCTWAALGGHLETLKWARENGCPWNEGLCLNAAELGRLEVLQWARLNGCPWDESTCAFAAISGQLEVLKWARLNGCPWNEDTCRFAADNGHEEVLKWAKENGCPCPNYDDEVVDDDSCYASYYFDKASWMYDFGPYDDQY